MRTVLSKINDSWAFNIFMAIILLMSGIAEIQADFRELEDQTLHAGHGMVGLALWHMMQGLEAALESLDYATKT
jgi:hypothetical protein